MRHINLFLGAQNGGFWGGGQKRYVEKVYVLFPSLMRFASEKQKTTQISRSRSRCPQDLKNLLMGLFLMLGGS